MFSVTFNCPVARANKQGVSKIQLWVNVGGVRKTTMLELATNPSTFTKDLTSKKTNPINTYCNNIRNTINTIFANNPTYTALEIIECFKGKTTTIKTDTTLTHIAKTYLKTMSSKVDIDFTLRTYNKYNLTLNRFIDYKGGDINITNITNSDIIQFQNYLYKMNFDINTIAGYMKKLKHFLNWCIDNNYISSNPFRQFKIRQVVREVQYLTIEEVEKIYNKDFNNDRLNKVRDLFVFACNSGLSFADLCKLSKDDIQENNGVYFIRKDREKTGVKYTTILSETAMEILNRYDFKLPILSNQKYNGYLKEIADICNINKPLHTHIARHTFATTTLNKGLPIEIVSKMLGHSDIKMTQRYAKVMDNTILSFAGLM